MAWTQAVRSFMHSGAMLSMAGGMLVTGSYVVYIDKSRYTKMMDVYSRGNILPPLAENDYEIAYVKRPNMEASIRQILRPTFQNEYFVISGPVGAGKTRLVVESIREMISTSGKMKKGAPIYVLINQGRSFPDTLAQAVNFHFDEHINFRFFLDFIMRIHSFPGKDDSNKLVRVLDAIEKSSFMYMKQFGRPVVLVIDGVDSLNQVMPGALERLQEKAKIWADTNSVKVVLIINNEETQHAMHNDSSNWSRASGVVFVQDLTKAEAFAFLESPEFMEQSTSSLHNEEKFEPMSHANAEKVYNLVGGRIHHLIACKRNYLKGVSFEETEEELMSREREKFVHVSKTPGAWQLIGMLRIASQEGTILLLRKLITAASVASQVQVLAKRSIVRYERRKSGTIVKLESRLTERVVEEMQRVYKLEVEKKRIFSAQSKIENELSQPTSQPTPQPTSLPTSRPTPQPTSLSTSQPTSLLASEPASQPTLQPTSQPASQSVSQNMSLPTSELASLLTPEPVSLLTSEPASLLTPETMLQPTSLLASKPA